LRLRVSVGEVPVGNSARRRVQLMLDDQAVLTWVNLSALTWAAHPAVPGDGVVVLNKYATIFARCSF
jgi:hypothetical protein